MGNKTSGLSAASLVLGVFTIVIGIVGWLLTMCLLPVGYIMFIGVITGIVGIILGVMGKKKDGSGVATGGLVTSIIGLVFCGILFIACVACTGILAAASASV